MSEKERLHEACTRIVELYFEDVPLKEALEQGREYYNELGKGENNGE